MRHQAWLKRLIALSLCLAMVFSASAYTWEVQAYAGDSEMLSARTMRGQADQDGFVIEDGVLTGYTGSATKVTIPDGVTEIGYSAFEDCKDLVSVTIPYGVTDIDDGAFLGCASLTTVVIPHSVVSIDRNAFRSCYSLTDVTIPDSVTYLGDGVFGCCESLEEIYIPGSVQSIETETFYGCSRLARVTLGEGVQTIDKGVFEGCNHLKALQFPSSLSYIDHRAFRFYFGDRVIYGPEGSYAQSYASEEGWQFIAGEMPPKQDISDCRVTLELTGCIYDGEAKRPMVTVVDGSETLDDSYDYTVEYKNNVGAGSAEVTVSGMGNYTGSVTRHFTIRKANQILKYTRLYKKKRGSRPFTMNVRHIKGNGKLTYSSSNNKVATVSSKGKVTIKGTGVATITAKAAATQNYNAAGVKVTIKVSPAKQTVKSLKTAKGRKLTVKWKKDTRAIGYQIQYSTDKKFKKGVKTVTVTKNKTTSKTLAKLTKGKKYYVRVRAYKTAKVNGKSTKLYGAWSKAKRSGSIKK